MHNVNVKMKPTINSIILFFHRFGCLLSHDLQQRRR